MDDNLKGNTDSDNGNTDGSFENDSEGSAFNKRKHNQKKRVYEAMSEISEMVKNIASAMDETNRVAKQSAEAQEEKNRLTRQSQMISLAQHLGEDQMLRDLLASFSSASG